MERLFAGLLYGLIGWAVLPYPAFAADEPNSQKLEALPDVPPPPERVHSGEAIEPDVTIIQKGNETTEEYRINNRLYMIKVVPVIGKPYYLLDNNGDGTMETEINDLYKNARDVAIPHWVLFSW